MNASASHDALVYEGSGFDRSQFSGAFWISDAKYAQNHGFEELKRFLSQGNDYCREIAAVFKERAAIEETYAKSLQKLKLKTAKLDEFTHGSLRDAWSRIILEFEEQAAWHLRIADMFKSRICESLLGFEKTLRKDHKVKQVPVEKSYAKYQEETAAMLKSQRSAFTRSRDVESAEVSLVDIRENSVGKYGPKDIAKAEKSVKKCSNASQSADEAYKASLVKLQESQEDWETSMIQGCNELQELECKRINQLKQVFYDISHTYSSLLPDMTKSYQECSTCAQNIDEMEVIKAICDNRGTGEYVTQLDLYTIYEENLQMPMNSHRRELWLKTRLNFWKSMVTKQHSAREGLLRLWDASKGIQAERHSNMDDVLAVKRKLVASDYNLVAVHATVFKLRDALYANRGEKPLQNSLQPYIHVSEDKTCMRYTLCLPATYVVDPQALLEEEAQQAAGDSRFGIAPNVQVVSSPAQAYGPVTPQSAAPDTDESYGVVPNNQGYEYNGEDDEDSDDDDDFSDNEDQQSTTQYSYEEHQPPQTSPFFIAQQQQEQQEQQQYQTAPPPPPPPPMAHSTNDAVFACQCRALYDYDAQESDELTIRAGDILNVTDSSDDVWWKGISTSSNVEGMFPREYVELL
eukprot:m.127531 g.127531  ORF g.127531 m.127531 type:complete len:632 (-) comp15659_c2_seq1:291-2186(-)